MQVAQQTIQTRHQQQEIVKEGYNGWSVLIIMICMVLAGGGMLGGGIALMATGTTAGVALLVIGCLLIGITSINWGGFYVVPINECSVLELCSKYHGTTYKTGCRWLPVWYSKLGLSLRVRNFETHIITSNDAYGSPVQMQVVIVYQVRDAGMANYNVQNVNEFVRTQSEAAVRTVLGMYPYEAHKEDPITLRGNSKIVSETLTREIQKQCDNIGVMIIESRVAYLAYAPEIAATMLRRQQVGAVVQARQQIVDGAVSMVELALQKLANHDVVDFDDSTRADMVSRLVVVLCGDQHTTPVMSV